MIYKTFFWGKIKFYIVIQVSVRKWGGRIYLHLNSLFFPECQNEPVYKRSMKEKITSGSTRNSSKKLFVPFNYGKNS